tara:strand:- start:96 stop:1181 length:1086 start_codon:yes stop_codon:yes gene_type:complete
MTKDRVQDDALNVINKHFRCGLNISMGVGKTRIALQHMMQNSNQFSTYLVVAPKKTIFQAWRDECVKMNADHLLNKITFSTYLSLNKQENTYDVVYLDECHSLLSSHRIFLESYTGKILGLTGTPPIYGDKEQLVNQYCPIVYDFEVDDATDSKILNDYKIIVHMIPMSNDKNVPKKRKDGGVWYVSESSDYEYQSGRILDAFNSKARQLASIMRMKAMMEYPSKDKYVKRLLNVIDDKCIIFANTQKQADTLCKHSYHSKNAESADNLEMFSSGNINRLSCVLQLSEGVSIPGLKQGIIMHAYGNERKSAQRIGRLLRLNPNETAVCHILCYENTVDEKWVKNALSSFSDNKIKYYKLNK